MARALVVAAAGRLGGRPLLREGFITDNGNIIIDIHGLNITEPGNMEDHLNSIPGVVTNGIFSRQGADVVLMGTAEGVVCIE